MPRSTAEFLQRLRKFVQDEAETQFQTLSRQWSHLLQERVARGWAIEGLHVTHFQNGIVRLTCATNDSRFREGDLVVLHHGNPQDENAQHCELQYDGETELEVSLIRGNEYFFSQQSGDWIMDQDWFDSSPFYLSALDTVADSQLGRSIILPLIKGSLTPKIDYARYERAKKMLNDNGLNESQIEAVAMSYATDLLHLIQGPPGTGKTLMLAHLARLLVGDGRRVYVTGISLLLSNGWQSSLPTWEKSI